MASNLPAVPATALPDRVRWSCRGASAAACALVVWKGGAPLGEWVTWVGLIMLFPALYVFLGNAWCLARKVPVAFRIYKDEDRRYPRDEWGSTISPASFALVVALIMLASKS